MVCFHGIKRRKKRGHTESTWAAVPDTRIIIKKTDSLSELRKQSRNLVPKFPVYPFTLLKQDNVVIPYTATVAEILPYLKKDMIHFKCGVIALVWKGSQESYEVLCGEFRNKDYYRRKLVIEYLVYHDMFEMNGAVLGEPVLDGHELVVKAALEKIEEYHIFGLKEEVLMAMECWPEHEEIKQLCKKILDRYEVNYQKVLTRQKLGEDSRRRNSLIYGESSQTILQERSSEREYFEEYLGIIRCYYPHYTEHEGRALLEMFAKEGCGYAALATTLVQHFASAPDAFRKYFRWDLLQSGRYIVDRIMLDFYCMMDGPNHGMTVRQMTERYSAYCNAYQIQVDMECLENVTVERCKQCLQDGYLLLFAGNFTMYFAKYQPSHVKGWHIMNICDVAENGTITVVSWGRIYTMQLADIRPNYHFVSVKYPTI